MRKENQTSLNRKENHNLRDLFFFPLFAFGTVGIVSGFIVLSFVNTDASNLPGILSPLLLIAGYLFVFISLFIPSIYSSQKYVRKKEDS